MCKQDHKIHLCTCADASSTNLQEGLFQELNELKKTGVYILIKWKLYRFVKNEWTGLDGMLIKPVSMFTAQFTSKFIQNEMNSRNCFDFDYIPNQGDCIVFESELVNKIGKKIKKKQDYEFISLIFKNEKWQIESYDTFYNTIEKVKNGIVRIKINEKGKHRLDNY